MALLKNFTQQEKPTDCSFYLQEIKLKKLVAKILE